MNNSGVYDIIKQTARSFLPDARVLLFGSYARGDNNKDSDYDLMVITPHLFTQKEKMRASSSIHKAIIKMIHAPVDVLMYSEAEILEKKELPGHIVRSALKDAITL